MIRAVRRLPPGLSAWFPYVLLASGTMVAAGIVGAAVGAESSGSAILPVRRPGTPAPDLATVGLFTHNAALALRSALGVLTLGVYTVWVQAVNGFVLGAAVADVAGVHGVARTVLSLVPHGVFELPAIWLSGAIGFRWVRWVWAVAGGDRDRISGPRLALESLLATGVTLALLFVAAVVEANVSVHLL